MALQSCGSNLGHVIGSFVGLATDSMLFGLLWVNFSEKIQPYSRDTQPALIPGKIVIDRLTRKLDCRFDTRGKSQLNPELKLVCLTGFDL